MVLKHFNNKMMSQLKLQSTMELFQVLLTLQLNQEGDKRIRKKCELRLCMLEFSHGVAKSRLQVVCEVCLSHH